MHRWFVAWLLSACLSAQTVQESFARDPGSLDFIRGEGYEQMILQALTGDSLVGLDEKCQVVPRLAKSWSVKGQSIRFCLREDARFSDGSKLQVEDVLWTFAQIQHLKDANPQKKLVLSGVKASIQKGDLVVDSPKPPVRLLMELARIGIAKHDQAGLGSGPYALERKNGEWFFTAREHFLQPRIREFHFRLVQEYQAVLQNLQKGWLSIGVPPPRAKLRPPSTHVEIHQPTNAQLVVWSHVGAVPLRYLERWRSEAFPTNILGERAKPSRGLWPETLGFPVMSVQGSFSSISGQQWELLYAAGDEMAQNCMQALRERARKDGVILELRPLETALLNERLQKGDFQLACALVIFDPHPWAILEYLEPKGPMNFTGWTHPKLKELLPKLQKLGDPAWTELQKVWSECPAALPILDFTSEVWVDRHLKVIPSALGLYLSTPGPAAWSWAQ